VSRPRVTHENESTGAFDCGIRVRLFQLISATPESSNEAQTKTWGLGGGRCRWELVMQKTLFGGCGLLGPFSCPVSTPSYQCNCQSSGWGGWGLRLSQNSTDTKRFGLWGCRTTRLLWEISGCQTSYSSCPQAHPPPPPPSPPLPPTIQAPPIGLSPAYGPVNSSCTACQPSSSP